MDTLHMNREVRMGFAVSRQERADIRKAAKAAKAPVSGYIRQTLLGATASGSAPQKAIRA